MSEMSEMSVFLDPCTPSTSYSNNKVVRLKPLILVVFRVKVVKMAKMARVKGDLTRVLTKMAKVVKNV